MIFEIYRDELIFWNFWNVLVNLMLRRYCKYWILMLNVNNEFFVNVSNI